jgi:hypothetical protein
MEKTVTGATDVPLVGIFSSYCSACKQRAFWVEGKLVYPKEIETNAPKPNLALEGDVLADYKEASEILSLSPRGTAALLRLVIQKLVNQILPGDGDLNFKIGELVKQGLREDIRKALDTVRVIGNEAVHPGQIDLKDNHPIAEKLFKLVNRIAEDLITSKKELEEIYSTLPPDKLKGIENRDKK